MKKELNSYFQDLEESQVRSLAEVIQFNNLHAEQELPPRSYLHPPYSVLFFIYLFLPLLYLPVSSCPFSVFRILFSDFSFYSRHFY